MRELIVFWRHWLTFFFCAAIVVDASFETEIPCSPDYTHNTPYIVYSYSTYTLTNCSNKDVLFLDMTPSVVSDFVFENFTLHVVGGTVLPRLSTSNYAYQLAAVNNLRILITGTTVVNRSLDVALANYPLTSSNSHHGARPFESFILRGCATSLYTYKMFHWTSWCFRPPNHLQLQSLRPLFCTCSQTR